MLHTGDETEEEENGRLKTRKTKQKKKNGRLRARLTKPKQKNGPLRARQTKPKKKADGFAASCDEVSMTMYLTSDDDVTMTM